MLEHSSKDEASKDFGIPLAALPFSGSSRALSLAYPGGASRCAVRRPTERPVWQIAEVSLQPAARKGQNPASLVSELHKDLSSVKP